jgi:hypothetical protein
MFNRVINPRSNFALCLMAGLLIGINASRDNMDVNLLVLPAMTLYAAVRFAGDVDQRTSQMVGMVIGILAGAAIGSTFRNYVLTPPAASSSKRMF